MASSVGPSALWYLTRGTGAVALVLLTMSVALGVANVRRVHTERVPRFVGDAVHRSVSLLALAFLAVHILALVLDPFAPIRLIDAVVPFVSAYRPVWLGLGAIASDLLIAVAFTSVLRRAAGRPKLWQRHRHPDGSSRGETRATRGSRGMSVAVELLLPRLLLGIGARPIAPLEEHLGGEDRSAGPRG